MREQDLDALKWALAEIRERMEGGFFGEVTFKMNDGRIVNAEVRESMKPPAQR